VGVFALFAAVVFAAEFGSIAGFTDGGISIVEDMGYALIGSPGEGTIDGTEDFLVALLLVAILLDAALDGALLLAKRDDGGDD
jgi:hypothetical protein